jgi:hypothetical protein
MSGILDRLSVDEQEAKTRLVERWFRELTPEQESALDQRTSDDNPTVATALADTGDDATESVVPVKPPA